MENVKVVTGNNLGVNLLGSFGATSTGAGSWTYMSTVYASFQAVVTGTGSVSATVAIQGSNDGINAVTTPINTITIASGASPQSDGFTAVTAWKYVRANVTALTGTGAHVQVIMGN